MKHLLVAATLVTVLCLVPERAAARTDLGAAPLKGGASVVCSCTNLTTDAIRVNILIRVGTSSTSCQPTISPGREQGCTRLTTEVSSCSVKRSDGKSVRDKQLACSFASLDASGSPTAVVPVDKKLRQ